MTTSCAVELLSVRRERGIDHAWQLSAAQPLHRPESYVPPQDAAIGTSENPQRFPVLLK
jgi:hypothetical protein